MTTALPSLADLATAERPPAPVYRVVRRTSDDVSDTPAALARETAKVLADLAWRATLPAVTRLELRTWARSEADRRLTLRRTTESPTELRVENEYAVMHGAALAAAHTTLLDSAARLLDGVDRLVPRSHLAALPEDGIHRLADDLARAATDGLQWRADLRASQGLPPLDLTPDDRRAQDPAHQRRRLRREAGRARQHLAAVLGTVGKGAAPYADSYTLARWTERQEAQRVWAGTHDLVGQDGTKVPMKDIVAASHAGQRARLYAVTLGVDELAQRQGLVPLFITLTLPPEWHPNPKHGRTHVGPVLPPHEADRELQHRWVRFRALLAKRGVETLGMRVIEPHEDGCPHLHSLLYVTADQVEHVDHALCVVAPEPVPPARDRDGNVQRVASKLVVVDRGRASPATYVAKYVLATCAGVPTTEEREADTTGKLGSYEQVRATASERGWRRFSFLGVHGIQRVWQCLVTTRELPAGAPARVVAAWTALQEHKWGDALEALGATAGRDEGVRLAYQTTTEHVDQATGEITQVPLLNRYGEPTRKPCQVEDRATGWTMPLTRQRWTVEPTRATAQEDDQGQVTVAESFPRPGDHPRPVTVGRPANDDRRPPGRGAAPPGRPRGPPIPAFRPFQLPRTTPAA